MQILRGIRLTEPQYYVLSRMMRGYLLTRMGRRWWLEKDDYGPIESITAKALIRSKYIVSAGTNNIGEEVFELAGPFKRKTKQ